MTSVNAPLAAGDAVQSSQKQCEISFWLETLSIIFSAWTLFEMLVVYGKISLGGAWSTGIALSHARMGPARVEEQPSERCSQNAPSTRWLAVKVFPHVCLANLLISICIYTCCDLGYCRQSITIKSVVVLVSNQFLSCRERVLARNHRKCLIMSLFAQSIEFVSPVVQ